MAKDNQSNDKEDSGAGVVVVAVVVVVFVVAELIEISIGRKNGGIKKGH